MRPAHDCTASYEQDRKRAVPRYSQIREGSYRHIASVRCVPANSGSTVTTGPGQTETRRKHHHWHDTMIGGSSAIAY
eukprot:1803855-Rhodomonas_salina.1